MISSRTIAKIVEKFGKKIGKQAKHKLETNILKDLENKIKKSARNADFAGRKIIKDEDVE